MNPIFSDRIGKTKSATILQLDEISDALRNSLWNYLYKRFFSRNFETCYLSARYISEYFLKIPIDEIPMNSYGRTQSWIKEIFYSLTWYDVYNLIEFLHHYCAKLTFPETIYVSEVNSILREEMAGYQFIEGILSPITNPSEIESITNSIHLSMENNLLGVNEHIKTAIELLSQKPKPDYRNSIKESISAIEALVKLISSEQKGGLEKAISILDKKVHFHRGFKSALLSFYGYTSDEDGIRHPILEESSVGFDEAIFMIVTCSAIINFMISKASNGGLLG